MAIAGVGAISVVIIVMLLGWARTPEYATVFSNLNEDDAAAIVNKLKESKIPYEIANGGTAIQVPSSMLYDTRLQLASAGLPQGGGVGFELFNQANFGMTDFVQKINYQRALEGELSRTINHLGPVDQSRVHIVIPQPTLYTDNQKEATASVVLMLKPGQRLKEAQVQGIAQLVSSSVEGLKPQNITIVDANGNVLSDSLASNKDAQRISASQLDTQKAFETDLEQRVQGMLDKVLGFGKATVRIRAALDWDQYESSSETYSPLNKQPQVRSSRETVEKYGELPPEAGGVPGSRANIPGYAGVITNTTSTTPTQGMYEKKDTTTNYELSKTLEKTSRAPGAIKKLSVAVVLDGSQQADAAQIKEVSKLVSAAVGIDETRGDVLAVSSMPFNRDAFASDVKSIEEAQQRETYFEMGKIAAMAIGPVLLLLLLFLITRRGRPRELRRIRQLPGIQQPELAAPLAVAAIGAGEQTIAPVKAPVVTEDPQQKMVKEQVTTLVKTKPDVAAELIKTWLQEDVR